MAVRGPNHWFNIKAIYKKKRFNVFIEYNKSRQIKSWFGEVSFRLSNIILILSQGLSNTGKSKIIYTVSTPYQLPGGNFSRKRRYRNQSTIIINIYETGFI